MVQTIIPRPIAWVLSDSGDGRLNLAPYSFFSGVCSDPPLIMLSAGKKPEGKEKGQEKDTRMNIRERKHFVVHIPMADMLADVNDSAATLDHGVSEVESLQLDTVPFDGFALPRLAHCKVAMACELYRLDEIGHKKQAVIYGEVKHLYLDDEIVEVNDKQRLVVDPHGVDPLARLGGSYYAGLGDLLSAKRPK